MEIPILIILLCCTSICLGSEHDSHTIPVEGYETELHNLGEHVEYPETPIKVIKITKTIAVKVPVPYPVKVVEKVPYPVHVNKPYPVPVPQIVKIPVYAKHAHEQESHGQGHGDGSYHDIQQFDRNSYEVQENPQHEPSTEPQSYEGVHQNQNVPIDEEYSREGSPVAQYDALSNGYQSYSGDQDGNKSFESKSYDKAIQEYLKNQYLNGNNVIPGVYH